MECVTSNLVTQGDLQIFKVFFDGMGMTIDSRLELICMYACSHITEELK